MMISLLIPVELGLDGHEVEAANFPLPNLSKKLQVLTEKIYAGPGFAVLSGLELTEFTHEDNLVIYLGISGYIASNRGVQDNKGSMFGAHNSSLVKMGCLADHCTTAHIREAKHSIAPQDERPVRHSNTTSVSPLTPSAPAATNRMHSTSTQTRIVTS